MFIRLLADGGIILAEKQRFEEEKHLYEDLKRNLGREWLLLCDIPATERRAVFELGEVANLLRCYLLVLLYY